MNKSPNIGDRVRVWLENDGPYPAVVVAGYDDNTIDACIFTQHGVRSICAIEFGEKADATEPRWFHGAVR
jgi:hypothetical protein